MSAPSMLSGLQCQVLVTDEQSKELSKLIISLTTTSCVKVWQTFCGTQKNMGFITNRYLICATNLTERKQPLKAVKPL